MARLIADTSVEELVRQASGNTVRVRSPQAEDLRGQIAGPDIKVVSIEPGLLEIQGLTAVQIGEAAAAHGFVLHELTPLQVSLEQAFMEMTRDQVVFRTGDLAETDLSVAEAA